MKQRSGRPDGSGEETKQRKHVYGQSQEIPDSCRREGFLIFSHLHRLFRGPRYKDEGDRSKRML